MSPTYSPLLAPSRPRLQINQSTTIPRRLTVVLSFSMCIFSEKWSILVSVSFLYLQTANWASKLFFFFLLHKPGRGERGNSAGLREDRRPPGYFLFFMLMIINPLNRDIESLFYYISNKKEIILDFMLEERDCLFPSLDRHLCLASFHGNQRVLMDPRGTS